MTAYELPWDRDEAAPLAARIAATEARRIVEGEHPPGQLLTEVELAQAAGASRTPAREAMLQLEAWGLVRIAPKKGAVVTTATPQERRDLLNLRAMLESGAATAIARAPDAQAGLAADLSAALDRQDAALDAGDALGFASADFAFHTRIIASMGNEVVERICATLGPRFARMTYDVAVQRPSALPVLLREHRELAALLASGDGDGRAFAELLRTHLSSGHDLDLDGAR